MIFDKWHRELNTQPVIKKRQRYSYHSKNTQKSGVANSSQPRSSRFNYFIYESLSIQFHNSVKRTRDVMLYVFIVLHH